jgi:7-carboxy-7-deazaguanine synthase
MRLSEIYTSVQGEGPRVGQPTQFVRFAGCNLRCPGWPCDTPFAIDPELYRKEWLTVQGTDIARALRPWPRNVCLTGGEPLLQNDGDLRSLISYLKTQDYSVECFSNGTISYSPWLVDNVHFVMDWKLSGSGEDFSNEMENRRLDNLILLKTSKLAHAVKFTIADPIDFDEARKAFHQYDLGALEVFAGVVWGKMENKELVKLILEHEMEWRLNVQVHNHIWDRSQRGI